MFEGSQAASGGDAESMFRAIFRKAFGKKRQRRNGKGLAGTEPLETRVLLSGSRNVDEGPGIWDMSDGAAVQLGSVAVDGQTVTFSGGVQTQYNPFSAPNFDTDTFRFELKENAGQLARLQIKIKPSHGQNAKTLVPTRKSGADSFNTVNLDRVLSAELLGPGLHQVLQVVDDQTLHTSLSRFTAGVYTVHITITDNLRNVWASVPKEGGRLAYAYDGLIENQTITFPINTADVTEAFPNEFYNQSEPIGTIGLNKSTTIVNGFLNSNRIVTGADHDAYEFRLPSRGVTGSKVRIRYQPVQGPADKIQDLIQATLTTQFGHVTVRPELPQDAAGAREILFDLKGYDAQTPFRLELKTLASVAAGSYSIEFTHALPFVALGPVVSLSEGFGYLSTIEGLGKAYDASSLLIGSTLTQPIKISSTNRATIESWFYPKSSDGSSTIWQSSPRSGQVNWELRQVNGRGLHVYVRRGRDRSANVFDAGKSGVLNTDAWNHLAMTFDGRQLRLFVNGVSVLTIPENSGNSGFPSILNDFPNFAFGGGLIDDLRIWNVARSQAEIQQGLLASFSGTEPGLQGYWNFDKMDGRSIADLSPNNNSLHLPPVHRVENAVPQIGYVEVLLDQKVTDPKGLFVAYELSGTAKATVDFIPSRFRTVTSDPTSEREGIIIPFGEKSGRIYFMAKPDALAEATESINITLKTFSFEGLSLGQDYRIAAGDSTSLEIVDSGAYKVGIAVTDASGRAITANNPLHLDPVTKLGKFFFRLTSQPTAAVERIIIQMDSNSTLSPSTTRGGTFAVDFKAEEWDKPVEFTVRSFLTSGTEGSFEFSSDSSDGHGRPRTNRYLTTPVKFSTTLNLPPREAHTAEGSSSDAVSTTPTVNLKHHKDVREDASKPGLFSVELSAPAPAGGLVVHYTVSTSSHTTAGSDYRKLPGFVFVPEGLRQAEIPVYPIDDFVYEGVSEDLIISLDSNSHYHVGTAGNPKIAIIEDDHSGIAVVNTSIIDVTIPKSPARPVNLSEASSDKYNTTFNVLTSVGKSGNYEVPAWSYTGGLASKVASSDGDTIPFELSSTGDSTAKLTLTLTPTTALGTKTLPTVRAGGDSEHNITLDRLLSSGLRLTGSSSTTAGVVVSDNKIEWSLAGLAAGRYLVDLSLPVISQILTSNTDPNQVLTYEYRLELNSSPAAPFEVSTTRTETGLSSSYSTLMTNEPLTSQTAQLEPNNNTIVSAPDLGVVTQNAEVLKQTVSSSADKDHFRFTLDSTLGRPDTMIARFSHTSQSDLRLQLLSTTGTVIKTSDEQSNNEYMDLRDVADGEYVALVTASPRGASKFIEEPYALKLTRLQLGVEPGPNDTLATSPHLGAVHSGDRFSDFSLNTATDQDYFRFTLDTTSGRPDSVSLLSNAADGMLGMALYSLPDENEISSLGGRQTSLSLAGLADGVYGVRVFRFAPGTLNKYDLGFGTISPLAGERNLNQVAVRLDSRPTANVSITFHSDDQTEGTVTSIPFVFTPDNWDQPQFVTVTPLADIDSGTNRNVTYTVTGNATSTDSNYHHRTIRFAVTNVDNGEFVTPTVPSQLEKGAPAEDNLPVATIKSLRRHATPEGWTDDLFLVKLYDPSTTDLTIGVDLRRGTATFGEDFTPVIGGSISNSTTTPGIVNVLFKAGETSKKIRLSLLEDKVQESVDGVAEVVRAAIVDAKEFRVERDADPGFTDFAKILDFDKAGVTVFKEGKAAADSISTVTEDVSGSPVEYSLKLTSKPTANVIVSVGSSDVSEGLISKSADGARAEVVHLVFTPSNWNVAQSVFLKGVEDHAADSDVPFRFVVSVQGEDDVYRKLPKQTFSAINADNDTLGITVSNPLTTVDGRQNVFSVALKSQPINNVRVTMNVPDEQLEIEGARAGDPYTLTFTPTNWNLPQLVRVTAVDDGIVEYFHRSQIVFRVDVGRSFDGPGIADNFSAERALDLGEISGGVRWTNMALRKGENRHLQDEWFRFKLTTGGSSLDKLRLNVAGENASELPTMILYSADGKRELRHTLSGPAASRELSLQGMAANDYLVKLGRNNTSRSFDFYIDDADRGFESVDLSPLPVSIKDNDLPTAEIIAGPTASEVFGKPSYFAVRLNAPTAAEASDVGIKVNFKITGGLATLGTSSSTLHDYSVLADHFTIDPHNPSIGTGWIRVAPGDLQANIGIVPVDDKAVEDMALTVHSITPIVGGYDLVVTTVQNESLPYPVLRAQTSIDILLPDGTSIKADVLHRKTLAPSNPLPGRNHEYRDHVEVSIAPADYARAATFKDKKFKARVESEDVQISLLPGDGYILPKAPDRQGTAGQNSADLDPDRTTSVMTIHDDDIVGLQVVEMGRHTTLAEGQDATYQVALTAEPQQDVTVNMTAGGGLLFVVDPALSATKTVSSTVYTLGTAGVPDTLDLVLDSVHITDKGLTAVLDARLSRITMASQATISTLSIKGANGLSTATADFKVPGSSPDLVDAAGNPLQGNWHTMQRLIVSGLEKKGNGSIELKLKLTGHAETTITLTPSTISQTVPTSTLTFTPSNWFQLQTVRIAAPNNSKAEPGEWHQDLISYKVTSTDLNWDGLAVPIQEVHIEDTQLDAGDTLDGIRSGLGMLQDGLLGLEVPVLGNIGQLPGVGKVFSDFERPLEKSLADTEELTVNKFKSLAESALQPLVDRGVLDSVEVTPEANDEEVRVVFDLEKTINVGRFDLSADLGLDALGIKFNTQGKASADLKFNLQLGFGWNYQFGFFLDAGNTAIHMGAKLKLEGNGVTTDNPENLFMGQGSIGFLQVNFKDDVDNRTELGITFDVTLNDLDNLSTVNFFDVNGDGILDEHSYVHNVGKDTNHDGRIDTNSSGDQQFESKTVAEPWVGIDSQGKSNDFPVVNSTSSDELLKLAANANWNTHGAKVDSFDEAELIRNEGVYRKKTLGNRTIVYLDSNRDGKLNISRRNVDPFALSWSSLSDRDKNGSEIWFTPTNANQPGELKVLTTGAARTQKFFVDVNLNQRADSTEEISNRLRKKLDKNRSGVLEGDVIQDGEGKYVQGTSVAFYDQNLNGRLDLSEKYISYSFDDFQLSTEVFSEDSAGVMFLDLNHDGIRESDELVLRAGTGDTVFLDINKNSTLDLLESKLSAAAADGVISIASDAANTSGDGRLINLGGTQTSPGHFSGGITRGILTINGVRFIDLDGNGELTLDAEDRPMEPAAEQASTLNFEDVGRLVYKAHQTNSSLFSGIQDTLMKQLETQAKRSAVGSTDRQTVTAAFNKLVGEHKIVLQPNDGDRLTLAELAAFIKSDRSEHATKSAQVKAAAAELFTYQFQGIANLGLETHTTINGSSMLPSMQFDLAVSLPLFNYGNAEESNDNGMSISFNNVALDLGSFINKFVTPIVTTANDLIDPIKPLIKALNADTILPGMLGMGGMFESDGKPGISLLEIARKLSPGDASKIDKAIKFADHVTKLVNLVDTLHKSLSSEESLLEFGDFSLSDLRAASDDPANSVSRPRSNATRSDGTAPTRANLPSTTSAGIDQQAGKSGKFKNKYNALKSLDGFNINLFEPATVLSLITGESNVTLVTYDIPDFEFDFSLKRKFSIWGPIAGLLEGGFNVKTDLSIGFDTSGIEEWSKSDFAANKSYLVFDGLYFDDWNAAGVDKDEMTVKAFIGAGVGLDIGIANGFVKGGVEGIIGLDVVDVGEQSGTSDGRLRGSDIVQKLSTNPADLFDLHGVINAFLAAEINVDFFFYSATVYEKRLATVELSRFKLNSNGSRGTSTSGNVQTGPISGSTVWFDANNNLVRDPGEPTTRSDARGHYDLIIPDRFSRSKGVIRTEGGLDASTGLKETDNLSLPAGAHGNITAFTALEEAMIQEPISTAVFDFNHDGTVSRSDRAAYLALNTTRPGHASLDVNHDGSVNELDLKLLNQVLANAAAGEHLPVSYAHSVVKAAFRIDPSINLTSFAHFDQAMAGNRLANPVLIAENTLNSVVTEIEGLLAGLSGQSSDDLHYSGVFSEAAFIAIGRQLLRSKPGKFDLGNRAQLRTIILEAATIAEELIASHAFTIAINRRRLDAILDNVVTVMAATVAEERALAQRAKTSVELARLITEWKVYANGTVSHDLHETAIGHMSGQQLVDADGHADRKTLEKILHTPLPPLFAEVADQVMSQNDFRTNVSVKLTRQNAGPGTLLLVAANTNKQLFPDGSITITELGNGRFHLGFYPAENQAGEARITLRGIDTAGGSAEQVVKITVVPTVDAPLPGVTLNDNGLLTFSGSSEKDTLTVERSNGKLVVSGRVGRQSILKTLPAGDVRHIVLRMGSGNDNVRVEPSVNLPVLIFGGDGHDNITSGGGPSVMLGGDGNDVLRGNRADDVLVGDGGNDWLIGESGNDRLLGGDGNDWLSGGDGKDQLQGGKGNDSLFGDGGRDRLQGNSGNDGLDGGTGDDQMNGGLGDDWLNGKSGNDLLIGGAGKDLLRGVSGNDLLIGGNLAFAEDAAAMQAIFSEWTAARRHSSRVASLRKGVGLNNQFRLGRETVLNDSGARDRVIGGGDIDWFFSEAKDVIVDFRSRTGESLDSV